MNIEKELNKISNLKDNWDGYGGVVPSKQIINKTLEFFKQLDTYPIENIYPNPNGTITVDIESPKGITISIEIGRSGMSMIGFFNFIINNNMSLTEDRNDPELHKIKENGQNKKYLVLSKEERNKGFIRPYRNSYIHVGKKIERDEKGRIIGRLIKMDDEDYDDRNGLYSKEDGYGGYIQYPLNRDSSVVGRYIKQEEVDAIINRKSHFGGCKTLTKMDRDLSETYARNPEFYGATFCMKCGTHKNVEEFVWAIDNEIVGS